MTTLLLGLAIFLGIHSFAIVAPAARAAAAAKLGVLPWKGLYSLVSIAGFVLLVGGYAAARQQPIVLWTPPAAMRSRAGFRMTISELTGPPRGDEAPSLVESFASDDGDLSQPRVARRTCMTHAPGAPHAG